ncbi:MAG: sigma-70 family RNA polymerase sigma factor [Acidobacteriota bacterium]
MSEQRAAGLDEADVETLFVRLEKPVHAVVYRWLWNHEDAREVVQEAFVRLWHRRADVRPATVEALVYRIALNLAASRRRKKKLWRFLGIEALADAPSAAPIADETLGRAQETARLREAVERLPDDLRRVVVLCETAELTHAAIGEVLGIPAGTVGSRRHRALKLLRQTLDTTAPSDDSEEARS